ncbi:DUF317 domain-containing protein [Streptomyces uncialis]|uniref:DUF317 domain-containing protein n=1 Tax=Streptomyces uncialis TaxID=1048205 RepID=UPI00365D248F
MLSSPDQQTLMRLEPDPDGQWWTPQHTRTSAGPGWSASFGAWTPVEDISAVTDALIRQPGAPSRIRSAHPARGEPALWATRRRGPRPPGPAARSPRSLTDYQA